MFTDRQDTAPLAPKDSRPGLLRLWFGVSAPVRPWSYALSGLGLMIFKYVVEAGVLWLLTATVMTPWDFLNPVLSTRQQWIQPLGDWYAWAWFLWTLPFLWIATSMSIRRAADAGSSPWLGLAVLVPLFNLFMMVSLALLPSRPRDTDSPDGYTDEELAQGRSAAVSIAASIVVGGVMLWVSVYLFSAYGASLFLGTPLVMGATAAYLYNKPIPRSWPSSVGIGTGAVFFASVALLLFALEGVICVAMALPLLIPLGAMGGALGKLMADAAQRPARDWIGAAVALPLLAGGESLLSEPRLRVVRTSIEIDAPPETVWKNVVAFPDLPRERAWYFDLGIACPERARIVGQGPGAIRYCEFTTGAFVEPITAWDEPQRLAFDVTEQPEPMYELSPYRHVHPPHLENALQSHRGEFQLTRLAGGRTRLEGRTWYSVDIHPQIYWQAVSDVIIGGIHERVLTHIKQLSETESATSTGP